jgi:hypothetical protein
MQSLCSPRMKVRYLFDSGQSTKLFSLLVVCLLDVSLLHTTVSDDSLLCQDILFHRYSEDEQTYYRQLLVPIDYIRTSLVQHRYNSSFDATSE